MSASRDKVPRDRLVAERLASLYPVWHTARTLWLAGAVSMVAAFVLDAWFPPSLPAIVLVFGLLNETTIVAGLRARNIEQLERRMVMRSWIVATWAAASMFLLASSGWASLMPFVLALSLDAATHPRLRLLSISGYGFAMLILVAAGGRAGILPSDESAIWFGARGSALDAAVLWVTASLAALGLLIALTYTASVRLRRAHNRTEVIAEELQDAQRQLSESHAALRVHSDELELEVERKTSQLALRTEELEERNRHLSIANAVSFAFVETSNDDNAVEQVVQLIARLLDARVAEIHVYAPDRPTEQHRAVRVPDDGAPPPSFRESALSTIAAMAVPLYSPIADQARQELTAAPADSDALGGFAILPLIVGGRAVGVLVGAGVEVGTTVGRVVGLEVGAGLAVGAGVGAVVGAVVGTDVEAGATVTAGEVAETAGAGG